MPALINVPTGAGKTAAILGAWMWRRLKNTATVGRRLIYCLPMRTLVEQTANEAKKAVGRLVAAVIIDEKRFSVHVLMGGDASDEWDVYRNAGASTSAHRTCSSPAPSIAATP